MSRSTDLSALYLEFTDALSTPWPARKGPRCRQETPNYSEGGYFLAVETAFENWEVIQNIGRPGRPSQLDMARKPRHGEGTEDRRS